MLSIVMILIHFFLYMIFIHNTHHDHFHSLLYNDQKVKIAHYFNNTFANILKSKY